MAAIGAGFAGRRSSGGRPVLMLVAERRLTGTPKGVPYVRFAEEPYVRAAEE